LIRTAMDAARKPLTPVSLDPRNHQPDLPLPQGYSKAQILDALCSVSIDGSKSGELHGYASADCERFLHTLALVPDGAGELLEIGGNPYFTSLLLRRFRPDYRLHMTNFFNGPPGMAMQRVRFVGFDGDADECDFAYHSVNIEAWPFPFADAQTDVVVFGEVLEHMTNDPMHAMREISRVLKPGGVLVLTTPNVARLENVVALLEGRNLYDPYSGYGPYGRHNREYTRDELHRLLAHCGFESEISYTANVHPDVPAGHLDVGALESALGSIRHREHDLGQYLMTRWRKVGECGAKRPAWLYRSYPAQELTG
jgi:SAM-dependent methyltransferase